MKKAIFILLTILILTITFTCCDNDDSYMENNNESTVNNISCKSFIFPRNNTKVIPDSSINRSITLYGATCNDGFTINNSRNVGFGFTRILSSINTEIRLNLPSGINTFTITKEENVCPPIDGVTDCNGSFIPSPISSGTILIIDTGESIGTAFFNVTMFSLSENLPRTLCDWTVVSGSVNADIQSIRLNPEITISYPDEVPANQNCVSLNVEITEQIYYPTDLSPSLTFTYSWEQIDGPSIEYLYNADTATAIFQAPNAQADADMTFQVTVTDEFGLKTTGEVTVTVLGR